MAEVDTQAGSSSGGVAAGQTGGTASAELVKLVAATANRLRMVQIDTVDENAQARQGYLADEIQRALASVPTEERPVFLEELKARFPTWDGQVQLPSGGKSDGKSLMDARELKDPSFVLSRLIELAASFNPQQRQAVIEKLRDAGLAPAEEGGAAGFPDELARQFRQKFKVPEGKKLDAAKVLALATMLGELATGLHQLAWTAWRTMAPGSDIRVSGNLQLSIAKFASGDPAVSREQVAQELERLRQLSASLIAAIGETGRQFAAHHHAKFAPTEIEASVKMEGVGMFANLERACWRKYMELAGAMDEHAMESDIRETIAREAEKFMRGLGR
jgi:hypothetical protein